MADPYQRQATIFNYAHYKPAEPPNPPLLPEADALNIVVLQRRVLMGRTLAALARCALEDRPPEQAPDDCSPMARGRDGAWVHVALAWRIAEGQVDLYLDGVWEDTMGADPLPALPAPAPQPQG